jgi:DNA-binding MarR family transcriptional regulator
MMVSRGPRKTDGGFELSGKPTYLMRRIQQRANDRFLRELGGSGLTKQQFTVLAAVEENEGVTQTELVELTGIDRSTLAEMVRRMVERGLLVRARTDHDARANAVRLGPAGRKALRGARAASERVEKGVLAGLPVTERSRFSRDLAMIVTHLERDVDGRKPHRRPPR